MNFDKTTAMRNAERHLSQGKIRAAIDEYRQVIEHDPKDFGTLNMLGDLHAKTSDKKAAVECYTQVADYYSRQGFAQKAIAVYNKVGKLEPRSVDVSEKLAELYKAKGALSEARHHFERVADHYRKMGRAIEALSVWKEIAQLDPNNTDVYLRIGEAYAREGQPEDAADAFTEAGCRFSALNRHEEGLLAFARALDLQPTWLRALQGEMQASIAIGDGAAAAEKLRALVDAEPRDRELLNLLIDCYLETNDLKAAEAATVKLVEIEPASYPKYLDLAGLYLKGREFENATRVLSMCSEYMLIGGQAAQFHSMLLIVLEGAPKNVEALRLLVRFCTWQRDEEAYRNALQRLYETAAAANEHDEERSALAQLVPLVPHNDAYAARLTELNAFLGFEERTEEAGLFERFFKPAAAKGEKDEIAEVDAVVVVEEIERNGVIGDRLAEPECAYAEDAPETKTFHVSGDPDDADDLPLSGELKLQKEIDSVGFYLENGYCELALKVVSELREEFGDRPEIVELERRIESGEGSEQESESAGAVVSTAFGIDDFRTELGLDAEMADDDGSDYDTHYHTAVAYQEMGLMEEAIREFQAAAGLVRPDDGTRRFFSCANLLGHCFMENGMPNLALKWYKRTLETPGLSDDEKQGVWYELAGAFEAEGDLENAGKYFEQVYAENVDFRDVRQRVRNLVMQSTPA